ncbi:hypothetical protein D9M71_509290 [compost metagenome]
MQQYLLARLQRGELEQVEPGGGIDFRQRRRFGQRQAIWRRQGMPPVDHHLFGHATTGEQCADAIAHLPGRTRPDFADHPGALQAKDVAGSRRRRIKPGFLQQIGAIQARCRHLDAYLPGPAGRSDTLPPYNLSLDALQCFHAASIVIPRRLPHAAGQFFSSRRFLLSSEPGAGKHGLICVITFPSVESA